MSATPRTDAEVYQDNKLIRADFARTLEIELNAALARVKELEALHQRASSAINAMHAALAEHMEWNGTTLAKAILALDDALGADTQPDPPRYLDRPDAPGWWWVFYKTLKTWELIEVINPFIYANQKSIWTRATPPPSPSEKEGPKS